MRQSSHQAALHGRDQSQDEWITGKQSRCPVLVEHADGECEAESERLYCECCCEVDPRVTLVGVGECGYGYGCWGVWMDERHV